MLVTKFRKFEKGNLVGFCNIELQNGFYINDLTIICKNGHRWVNFPARAYEDQGVKKHYPYMGIKDKDKKDAFDKQFFAALDDYIKKNPEPKSPEPQPSFWESEQSYNSVPF